MRPVGHIGLTFMLPMLFNLPKALQCAAALTDLFRLCIDAKMNPQQSDLFTMQPPQAQRSVTPSAWGPGHRLGSAETPSEPVSAPWEMPRRPSFDLKGRFTTLYNAGQYSSTLNLTSTGLASVLAVGTTAALHSLLFGAALPTLVGFGIMAGTSCGFVSLSDYIVGVIADSNVRLPVIF